MIIQNVRIMDPGSGRDERCHLIIKDGRIERIIGITEMSDDAGMTLQSVGGSEDNTVIDGTGLIAAPGLIDTHVHFRDPGFTYKEDIESGAKAAAAGGFTSIVLMANTKPSVDTVETLQYVLEKGAKTAIRIYSCANISYGMKGQELTDFEALKEAGAVGFTDDGIPLMDEKLVKCAMERAAKCGMPLSFHEEDPTVITNNGVNAGPVAEKLGIAGSPREAEIRMVRRDLELAAGIPADVVIQHISTAEGVELVRQARKTNPRVHAEVTPHHFTLTQDAVLEKGTLAKMNPPLREKRDREALIRGLADGTIEIIATDHAPHSKEEKDRPITEAPSGILGLETSLGLGIRELVDKGHLSLMELLDKMTYQPACLYQLEGGRIVEGGPADLVLFDPKEFYKVRGFRSKSQNSPFLGEKLPGKIRYTICGGNLVYRSEAE